MSSSRDTYHHGNLAEVLEAAAMQLLERMPAAEISLREVARAADVSHNAPYHHFRDRLGLLKVLAERSMGELIAEVERALSPSAGEPVGDETRLSPAAPVPAHKPAARLLAGANAYIRFAVERPHAFDVMYDPRVCIPGHPSEAMAPLIERLEGLLAEAAGAAGLTEAAEVRAGWSLMHGLGTLSAAGHFTLAEAETAMSAALGRMGVGA